MARDKGLLSDLQLRHWIKAGTPLAKADGNGLTFTLSAAGVAGWILRYRHGARRRELSIGRYPDIGLADARGIATIKRAEIMQGRNPAADKQKAKATAAKDWTVRELVKDYRAKKLVSLAHSTRWCEQYPSRERREFWIAIENGNDVKLTVHSRMMPARRGHSVNVLMLDDMVVGLANLTTSRQVNFVQADPPLLVHRCDGLAALGILGVGLAAAVAWDARSLLVAVPAAVLCLPLLAHGRFLMRGRLRMQVDSWLATVDVPAVGRTMLRRVKSGAARLEAICLNGCKWV